MQQPLQSLLLSRRWEIFIVSLIVVNAIILGLMTSSRAMATVGPLLEVVDGIILAVFTVEILLRIYAFRLRFFTDPWSLFDFFATTPTVRPYL